MHDDPATGLLLEFGLLLALLGLLTRVARRLGIPVVPLYLLGGLLLGSSGLVDLSASGNLVPSLAELGALLLLLLLGLEYSGSQLAASARRQVLPGIADVLLNAAPGAAAGLLLGWGPLGALVLGGVSYVSSSGVVSQMMRDLRWGGKPEAPAVVGLLVAEDLLMAPYLPILAAALAGASLLSGMAGVGLALLVVSGALLVAVRQPAWARRLLPSSEPVGLPLVVFGVAVSVAGLASLLGFSPAVAAFLVGLLLTGEVAEVARRRLEPLRELLAAVFFAYFGLAAGMGMVASVLLPALALAVASVAAKMATGLLAARHAGRRAGLRAGALLAARGEFSVLIAGVAVASGAFPEEFTALVAAYVLLTAMASAVLARCLDRPRAGPSLQFRRPAGWSRGGGGLT